MSRGECYAAALIRVVGMSAETNPEKTKSVLIRAMRSTTGRESTTFGFSILVTVTFGVQQHVLGQPTLLEIFLYATGAVLSFTLLEGFLSRGFKEAMPQHRTETLALGTSMNLLSVLFGLGGAVLVTGWIGSTVA